MEGSERMALDEFLRNMEFKRGLLVILQAERLVSTEHRGLSSAAQAAGTAGNLM